MKKKFKVGDKVRIVKNFPYTKELKEGVIRTVLEHRDGGLFIERVIDSGEGHYVAGNEDRLELISSEEKKSEYTGGWGID